MGNSAMSKQGLRSIGVIMLIAGLSGGCSDGTDVQVAKSGPPISEEASGGPPPPASSGKSKLGEAPPKGGGSPSKSPQEFSR
jgi:hypothetical protein